MHMFLLKIPLTVVSDVFLYYCPDCTSCPVNVFQMGQATWTIWAALKKYSLTLLNTGVHGLILVRVLKTSL